MLIDGDWGMGVGEMGLRDTKNRTQIEKEPDDDFVETVEWAYRGWSN